MELLKNWFDLPAGKPQQILEGAKQSQLELEAQEAIREPNPCVRLHGLYQDGVKCKGCKHLLRFHQEATWFKCEFRKNNRSEYGPDHKARWNACKKFEKDGD